MSTRVEPVVPPGFALSGTVAGLREHEPPLTNEIRDADWWGCPDWLIRGEAPFAHKANPGIATFAERVMEALPGELARLGPTRWDDQGWAVRIVENEAGYAIAAHYLSFIEASAEPEVWRWVKLREGEPEKGRSPYVLVGVKDREPVAIVAPTYSVKRADPEE